MKNPGSLGQLTYTASRRGMAGMSLVELMVALVLGLLILSGLVTVFVNTSAARNEIERTSRQIENGRYAIEVLSDDLRLAGFYGELDPAGAKPDIAVPGSLPDPCSTTVSDWGPSLYFHVQGYDASNGGLSCLLASYNYKTGTDVLVVRRVKTCAAGVSGCAAAAADKPYLQVALCADETPVTSHRLGLQGTETFTSTQKDCSTRAVQRQYLVDIYFISTDNGNGDSVPTLKRLELCGGDDSSTTCASGTPWTVTPLVEGIEQLNIEYGIDYMDSGGLPSSDGMPDAYTGDPTNFTDATGCATCTFNAVNNWMNVVTARFFVLARNVEASPGYTDSAHKTTYALGSLSVAAPSDSYRRHVYSSLVRIINPAGRRDTP